MPGGSLEYGEEPQDAVVREVWEETGLEVEVKELLFAKNSSARDQIGLFYLSEIRGGMLRPSDEMAEFQYFDLDNLPDVRPSDAILLKQLAEMVVGQKHELA